MAEYVPPGYSEQLHEPLIAARFQLMSDTALDALQHCYAILEGLLIAKVPSRSDISGSGTDSLEDSEIAYRGGMSRPGENLHGRMLTDVCMRNTFLLCTDCLLGDMTAAPTMFLESSSGRRLEQFVMVHISPCNQSHHSARSI